MPGSPVELIKEKLDIAEFLRSYLTLQPSGKNLKALCPFHKEKTPSFMVSPERQTWHCFGCNLGGDIFTFLMRYENLEFGEAIKVLSEKAGVPLAAIHSPDYKLTNLLYAINKEAAEFFKREFQASDAARRYLEARGLKGGTIETFELGWAPQSAEALSLHLLNHGFYSDDIIRAGVAFKSERGLVIDRFRGRIMFPLHNSFGKVVGFTGRILPALDTGEVGKYINSPETPIFNKSRLLYGFWKTKEAIREKKEAFLVEGQMDFLMSYQAGIPHAVATSGTALGLDHLRLLKRFADQLIVSFDTDEAGLAAGERAIDLADANDFNVRVVLLRDFKDPADAAKAEPEKLRQEIAQAKPATEFYFERYLPREAPRGAMSREYVNKLRVVLGKISNIASAVERNYWIKELGGRTGIHENVLAEEAERVQAQSGRAGVITSREPRKEETPRYSRRELLSQYVIAAACAKGTPQAIEASVPHLARGYEEVWRAVCAGVHAAPDQALDERLNLVLLLAGKVGADELELLRESLQAEYLKEKRVELAGTIKQAETEGDEALLASTLRELHRHFE